MKNPFSKSTTSSAINAEASILAKRHTDATARIAATRRALEDAKAERRQNLAADLDLGPFSARIRELSNELTELESLLIDIDAQSEDAAARLSAARDVEARTASADSLKKIALAAETRSSEIDKAIALLAKAISGLRSDLGVDTAFWPAHAVSRPEGSVDGANDFATNREVAAAVLADGLAKAMPWAFDNALAKDGYKSGLYRVMDPNSFHRRWFSDVHTAPLSTAEIIHSLIAFPLREKASEIEAGIAKVEPVQKMIYPDHIVSSAPPSVQVFVTRAFSYVATEFGLLEIVPDGTVRNVPEPVAQIGESQNLCLPALSPRGQILLKEAQSRKGSSVGGVGPEDCVQLGDVMNLRSAPREISGQAAV